jgi:hypothetical protein
VHGIFPVKTGDADVFKDMRVGVKDDISLNTKPNW